AEQDVLPHTVRDCSREFIFRQSAADGHQRPNKRRAARRFVAIVEKGFRVPALSVGTNDPQRQGIVEDFRRVEDLVGGTSQRDTPCGRAGLFLLHLLRVIEIRARFLCRPSGRPSDRLKPVAYTDLKSALAAALAEVAENVRYLRPLCALRPI